jgi:hypothetical protein
MTINIQRDDFDTEHGYQYRLSFKPNLSAVELHDQVHARVPVEASLCVSETGELTDLIFTLPKPCRTESALTFLRRQSEARIAPPQVFVTVPGSNGDAVTTAVANLDLDLAGRIIGMEIHWMPEVASS